MLILRNISISLPINFEEMFSRFRFVLYEPTNLDSARVRMTDLLEAFMNVFILFCIVFSVTILIVVEMKYGYGNMHPCSDVPEGRTFLLVLKCRLGLYYNSINHSCVYLQDPDPKKYLGKAGSEVGTL